MMNKDRMRIWKSRLVSTDNTNNVFNQDLTCKSFESETFSMEEQLSDFICSTDYYDHDTVILEGLQKKIDRYISNWYVNNANVITYEIKEKILFKTLEELCLDDSYVIMTFGPNLTRLKMFYKSNVEIRTEFTSDGTKEYYGDVEVINTPVEADCLVIIKKCDLHQICAERLEEEEIGSDLELLEGSKNLLYSNFDKVINDGDVDAILELKRKVKFYFKDNLKALRIKIIYDFDFVPTLANIQPIDSYLR